MLQNPCKTLGFKKNMIYKIPPGGGKSYPASGLTDVYCISILKGRLCLNSTSKKYEKIYIKPAQNRR